MTTPREQLARARIQLLATGSLCRGTLGDTVHAAIDGGVDVVQLREKELPDGPYLELSIDLGGGVQQGGALFILNDRVAVGQFGACDGVHLGQEDLPLSLARKLLGDAALIGVSTHSVTQARLAERGGADYIGVGPAFPTGTKDTGYEPRGPEEIAKIVSSVSIPAFAIGGITLDNLPELHDAGVDRIAVSSAILSAEDPHAVAREMWSILTS